jgi:hypothetical protein
VRREVGERVDRKHVHPRDRARLAVGAAGAHYRPELLREAKQAEVVHVHFGARGLHAGAVGYAEGAMVLGVVDHDVDLGADLGRHFTHILRIGEVKGQEGDLRDLRQLVESLELLPGLRVPDPDQIRLRFREGVDQGLPERRLAVGDEHLAELRIAGEFAQLPVVSHVDLLFGQRREDCLSRAIEHRPHFDFLLYRLVQMRHDRRSAIELHQSKTPGKPLAEEEVVAMVKDGASEQLAAIRLLLPEDLGREAGLARFAGRILHGAAVLALLQLEAPHRRGGGEAERDPAARRRRQRRQPGAQYRILSLRTL